MDLIPIIAAISTGIPWLDNTLRVVGIVYVVYSVFLNVLLVAYPESANWKWVQVSLAIVANIHGFFEKKQPVSPTMPYQQVNTLPSPYRAVPPPPRVPKLESETVSAKNIVELDLPKVVVKKDPTEKDSA